MQRRATRTGPWALGALTVLVLAATGACSGGDDDPVPADKPSPTVEATADPVALAVTTGSVQGYLPKAKRERVVADVAEVVDGWVEQAWVAGPWPREVDGAWGAFTAGAAKKAKADATLTSGAHYAQRVTSVVPQRRDVRVDLLAREGTPYAATARVTLDLEVTPTEEALAEEGGQAGDVRKVILRGRVFLTREKSGWKIFGHDLARGGW